MLKPITKVAVVAILSVAGAAWTWSDAAFATVSDQEVAGMSGAACPWFVWHVCTMWGTKTDGIPTDPDPKCDTVRCWIPTDNDSGVRRRLRIVGKVHREWCTTDGSRIQACGRRFKDGRDCADTDSTGSL